MEASYLTLGLALIGAGFLLLAAELFIPTGGVFFVLSVSGIAVGVVFAFLYDTTVGLFTLLGVFVAVPAFTVIELCVAVTAGITGSFTVIDWLPAVLSVTGKLFTPSSAPVKV